MPSPSDQSPDTHAEARRLIDALGGPIAAAALMIGASGNPMDRRTMQRIYAGKRTASPTLIRQLSEKVEAHHG